MADLKETKKELDLDKTVKDLEKTFLKINAKIQEINSEIQAKERSINYLKEERDRLHSAYKVIVEAHTNLRRAIDPFAELKEIEFD